MDYMLRKSGLLLFVLAFLVACTDSEDDSNGDGAVPQDPGTEFTDRQVSVKRNDKDGGQVTLRFYKDMPNVPYIAVSAFYRMMLPNGTMTVTRKGNSYELSTATGTATVDVVNDVLTSSSYMEFTSLMSLTKPGLPGFETCSRPFLKFDSYLYEPSEVATVTHNFRKYGIDVRDDGREPFFPFATLNDIFSDASYHMASYNGSKILVNADASKELPEVDENFPVPAFKLTEVGEDLADFRYKELCFVIDYLYGYPGSTFLEDLGLREKGLDATLEEVSFGKDVKRLLKSKNQADFVVGSTVLSYLFSDGGHTNLNLYDYIPKSVKSEFEARYNSSYNSLPTAVKQIVTDNKNILETISKLRKDHLAVREKKFGKDTKYVVSQDGKTAVIVMGVFMDVNYEGWDAYYSNGCKEEYWKKLIDDKKNPDLLVQVVEALKKARHDGVKNVLLDVSHNRGGEDDPTTAIVNLIGDKTGTISPRRKAVSWDMNMLTRQYLTKYFLVDRNFDGKFDEKDDEVDLVGDMNVVLLTSNDTFSNGSVFTAKMKDYGYQTWGDVTSGGSCSVVAYVTPDGMLYEISSYRSQTIDKNKENIDYGAPVDKFLTADQMYDIEYLNSLFH